MKWDEQTLGQICDREGGLIQTGPFGSQLHQSDYREEGIPVVMPQDIVRGRIDLSSVAKVAEETADRLARHKLKIGAIVMPRRGEINKRAFIKESEQGYLCGTGCIKIELAGTVLEPHFLYYYLEQPQVVSWIEQHAVGTTMLNLNTAIIRNVPIQFPALEIQHKAVSILSAYDDLIENNLRRMALMEEAARQLYREWFVRLRFPGYEHTRIVHGVPEGWEKRKLSQVTEINRATVPSSFKDQIEYIDISSVTPGSINETTMYEFEDAPSRARRVVEHGDIIWSCVRPNRRSHAVIWHPPPNLIASTGFAVITPTVLPTSYLYLATTTDNFVGYLTNRARGAAYPAVTAKDFEDAEIIKPNHRLISNFSEFATPIFEQLHNLQGQNEKLKQARDLLLPKLMSGEIAV